MTIAATVRWFAIIAALPGSGAAQDIDLSWIDHTTLEAGEILVDFGDHENFRGHIRSAVSIDAPVEYVWAILKDCDSAPDFVPTVQDCELVDTHPDQSSQVFRQRIKLAWYLPGFAHEFRLTYYPYHRIEVSRVSGPLAVLSGTWWLEAGDDQNTTLVYSLRFEPGMPIPRFVIGRILQRDVPAILAAVRLRAETTYTSDAPL